MKKMFLIIVAALSSFFLFRDSQWSISQENLVFSVEIRRGDDSRTTCIYYSEGKPIRVISNYAHSEEEKIEMIKYLMETMGE